MRFLQPLSPLPPSPSPAPCRPLSQHLPQHNDDPQGQQQPGKKRQRPQPRLQPLHATKTRLAPPPPPLSSATTLPPPTPPKPLVDARQLSPALLAARFPNTDFAVPSTLPAALRLFFTHPSILLICGGLAALLSGRISAQAPVTPLEALSIPLTVAGWVVQEWAIHRYLLHGFEWPGVRQ